MTDKEYYWNNALGWERSRADDFVEYICANDFEHEYKSLIKNLDNESAKTVNRILYRVMNYKNDIRLPLYTNQEQADAYAVIEELQRILKLNDNCYAYGKYFLPINIFDASVIIERLNLDKLENINYFKNKDILDVGAFIGDSALILSEYTDKKVYAFEPTTINYNHMLKTIQMNDSQNIEPVKLGMSNTCGTCEINFAGLSSSIMFDPENDNNTETIEISTVDKYVADNNLDIGLIKVDVEGAEQLMLEGSVETIRKFKPTLLISIYHNANDFFNIKRIIENMNLGYKFKIISQRLNVVVTETMLIAEPPSNGI